MLVLTVGRVNMITTYGMYLLCMELTAEVERNHVIDDIVSREGVRKMSDRQLGVGS